MPLMTLRKKQESIRPYDSVRRTTCASCPAGCGVKVFLNHGSIVDLFGDEDHPVNKGSFCPKGMLSYFHINHPLRITEPHIRENLDQSFRKVTWEEAIQFTAERMKTIAGQFGMDAVYGFGSETDPFDYLAGGTWFADHFGTANLPSQFFPASFGAGGALTRMFGLPGSRLLMNSPRDWCSSRAILLYGCDLAATDPMTFGPIVDARDRGATLLAVDSKRNVTTSKADLALRIKPGSGAMLLKGLLNLLIGKGVADEDFIGQYTEGFSSLKSDVATASPESVAAECWIDPEELKRMADMIARKRPFQVIAGDWFSRGRLSDEELCLCGALVCLTGSVGIPGGGLNLLNVNPFDWSALASTSTAASGGERDWDAALDLEDVLMNTRKPVRALIAYGNPVARLADARETKAALRDIPLVVHLGSYPDETFQRAHVSFPMSGWLEYEGLQAFGNGRALQWRNKVMDAPGSCRSALDFWTDLALSLEALGELRIPWKTPGTPVDHRAFGDYFLKMNPLTRAASVAALDPDANPPGGLLWPCTEADDLAFEGSRFVKGNVRGRNILFQRDRLYPDTDRRFPTAMGKVTFQRTSTAPTDRGTEGEGDAFPFVVTTGAPVDFSPNLGFFVTDRRSNQARPVVKIHPQIGKLLGIRTGETVTIENTNGSFTAAACLSDEVDPRHVWCFDGMDHEQFHFRGVNPNGLVHRPVGEPNRGAGARVALYRDETVKAKNEADIRRYLAGLKSRPD